ncbi:MAG: hypothetical protein AAGG51_24460 [Cyanobacteria bacterium P01_G01_bin.54]
MLQADLAMGVFTLRIRLGTPVWQRLSPEIYKRSVLILLIGLGVSLSSQVIAALA